MVRKVLLADDDQILQLAVERQLEKYGDTFALETANDGFEALKKLERMAVSLVVVDLLMPRLDGLSLLTHIQEKYPDIPVVIISAMPPEQLHHISQAGGVIGSLAKPFQVDQLAKLIVAALQKEARSGIMHHVSPAMFLQLMEMDGKTCTIRVVEKQYGNGGILYFRDGQLVDARVGTIRGIAAAHLVFGWDEVTVYLRNECDDRPNVINSDLQPIIMEALAARDESEDCPHGDEEGMPVAFAGDGLAGEHPLTASPLFCELPSAEAEREQRMAAETPGSGLKSLLEQELQGEALVADVYPETKLSGILTTLNRLGLAANFGDLKVGMVNEGQECNTMIIPGDQTFVAKVSPGCRLSNIALMLARAEQNGA